MTISIFLARQSTSIFWKLRFLVLWAPAEHATAPDVPISIYTYSTPNLSAARPFHGKLTCVRDISLPSCAAITRTGGGSAYSGNAKTLWAHMREGMSHPDAFFRYGQSVKIVSAMGENLIGINIPKELTDAVYRIDPTADVFKYLSSTSGDSISDKAWRHVWFNFYFWNDMMPLYSSTAPYTVNHQPTKISISDTEKQHLFSGKANSVKDKLIKKLNDGTITEDAAWEEYAEKIRKNAHSYRESIDSGLYHIGFLSPDGTLTDLGYKFVDSCERFGVSYKGIPTVRAILIESVLIEFSNCINPWVICQKQIP